MPVIRETVDGASRTRLLDDAGDPVPLVDRFLRHLENGNRSPNTVAAYAYDLQHFWRFLTANGLEVTTFAARHSIDLLAYLADIRTAGSRQRLGLTLVDSQDGRPVRRLAPTSVNRCLSAVSSFYEFLILSDSYEAENPFQFMPDNAYARVSDKHRPFMGNASRQRPRRRRVRMNTSRRLPRPLADSQVEAIFNALGTRRDRAIFLLMLDGGLRPGEVLGLRLQDVQYGRQRVVVVVHPEHPRGVRQKTQSERVVDLFQGRTLAAVNEYVVAERPRDTGLPWLFLVRSRGEARAMSYDALVRSFARAADRAGVREPWITPHALRHTHATRMHEGGMRDLVLQKRLGHASVESTQKYTAISQSQVVQEYRAALINRGELPLE